MGGAYDPDAAAAEAEQGELNHATDVIVRGFSISAPQRPLFVDADLKLASGRRYGLLGPVITNALFILIV